MYTLSWIEEISKVAGAVVVGNNEDIVPARCAVLTALKRVF
jgi:hypothetical protein